MWLQIFSGKVTSLFVAANGYQEYDDMEWISFVDEKRREDLIWHPFLVAFQCSFVLYFVFTAFHFFLFSKYFSFTNYNGADFCPKVLFLLFYVIYVAPVNYLLCGQSRLFVNPTWHLPPPAPPMNNSFPTHL